MKDFRVVQAKTPLKVTSYAPVRDFSPPAITVLGEEMNKAQEILYNNVEVTEFLIISPRRLLVRIPDSQVGRPLTSLLVSTSSAVSQKDALLSLGVDSPLKTLEGIDRLVQVFMTTFMTTPGSDIFDPDAGGGGQAIIGKPNEATSSSSAQLSLAVDRTVQQMLRAQAQNTKLPPTERLLSASLSNVEFDQTTTTLRGTVDLRSVAGESALVTLG
jgi:hypothetical protein